MSASDDRALRLRDITVLPTSFVLAIENAVVAGRAGWVLVDDELVDDVWAERGFPSTTLAAPQVKQEEELHLPGTSALLAMPWLPNYYHWTLQAAPRASMLGDQLASIDHWIVSPGQSRYQQELLHALGVSPARTVTARNGLHIHSDVLLAPSVPAPNRHIPAWVVDAVRGLFPRMGGTGEAIYVDRPVTDKRRLLNRTAVLDLFTRAGYRIVETGSLAVAQQAALFEGASSVAGVLGAGLTNAVYCRPGAGLLEIMPKNLVFPSYYKLARAAGLTYDYAIGTEAALPWPLRFPDTEADLVAPIEELEAMLR